MAKAPFKKAVQHVHVAHLSETEVESFLTTLDDITGHLYEKAQTRFVTTVEHKVGGDAESKVSWYLNAADTYNAERRMARKAIDALRDLIQGG